MPRELPKDGSRSFKKLNPHIFETGGLAPRPESQPSPVVGPAAEDARETYFKGRCAIRFTLFRCRLLDSDNPMPKYIVDALIEAGLLASDAQEHAKVEVTQVKVEHRWEERTVIDVVPLE